MSIEMSVFIYLFICLFIIFFVFFVLFCFFGLTDLFLLKQRVVASIASRARAAAKAYVCLETFV